MAVKTFSRGVGDGQNAECRMLNAEIPDSGRASFFILHSAFVIHHSPSLSVPHPFAGTLCWHFAFPLGEGMGHPSLARSAGAAVANRYHTGDG